MKNYWVQTYDQFGSVHELWFNEKEFFLFRLSINAREYNYLYFEQVDDFIRVHADLLYHEELSLIPKKCY
jgi:hypothetical protein